MNINSYKLWITIEIIITLICIGLLIWTSITPSSTENHVGTIQFTNPEELLAFKQAVMNPDYKIKTLTEVNGNYPVIVTFDVTTPYNSGFNYGDIYQPNKFSALFLFSFALFIAIFLLIFTIYQSKNDY